MTIEKKVELGEFPKQGDWLGRRVEVCPHSDNPRIFYGNIVREDAETPYKTIIQLDNGKYILSTECLYELKD